MERDLSRHQWFSAGRRVRRACALGLLFALTLVSPVEAQQGDKQPLDARRAFGYLTEICKIGPRYSGSQGMVRQQKLIADHFNKFGARVQFQPFDAEHPLTGDPVRMNNIIVSWQPDARRRILLACHYDTRPLPDRDLFNPRGEFVGANDGASGVALFMELAHQMADLDTDYGVDFVFFDGEELVYGRRGQYFLGSEHFSKEYRDNPPSYRYDYGILVDMVADRNLNIHKERNSVKYAPELVDSVWGTARALGVKEFIGGRPKHEVQDDHLPLNEIAKIPSIDIIDFDYRHWHTTKDTPENCSGASLAKVGRVLIAWLAAQQPK